MKVELRKDNVRKAILEGMAEKAMDRCLLGRELKHCTEKKMCRKVLRIIEKELAWSWVAVGDKLSWERALHPVLTEASLCVLTVMKNRDVLSLFQMQQEASSGCGYSRPGIWAGHA